MYLTCSIVSEFDENRTKGEAPMDEEAGIGVETMALKKRRTSSHLLVRLRCLRRRIGDIPDIYALSSSRLNHPEWERPKPGRRPDIFPQFSPMKPPLLPPLPCGPPEEEEEEEEKKEEVEEDPEKEELETTEKQ